MSRGVEVLLGGNQSTAAGVNAAYRFLRQRSDWTAACVGLNTQHFLSYKRPIGQLAVFYSFDKNTAITLECAYRTTFEEQQSLRNVVTDFLGNDVSIFRSLLTEYLTTYVLPEVRVGREFDASYFAWTMNEICEAAESATFTAIGSRQSRGIPTENTLHRIASTFWRFEKVKSVHVQNYRSELQVNVLLAIEKYDHDLMDELFDAEYDLRTSLNEIVFSFCYTPVGESVNSDVKHPLARALFTR